MSNRKRKVSFQGDMGAFSEIAANKLFRNITLVPCKTFEQVFENVEAGKVDYGVVPIENSFIGKIDEVAELLEKSSLGVCGEKMLKIVHCLIAKERVPIDDLKEIYAHPVALAQCKKFLSHLKDCKPIPWYCGSGAVGIIKQKRGTALIGSEKIARIHGLKVLKKGIQDVKNTTTRFLVISRGV